MRLLSRPAAAAPRAHGHGRWLLGGARISSFGWTAVAVFDPPLPFRFFLGFFEISSRACARARTQRFLLLDAFQCG